MRNRPKQHIPLDARQHKFMGIFPFAAARDLQALTLLGPTQRVVGENDYQNFVLVYVNTGNTFRGEMAKESRVRNIRPVANTDALYKGWTLWARPDADGYRDAYTASFGGVVEGVQIDHVFPQIRAAKRNMNNNNNIGYVLLEAVGRSSNASAGSYEGNLGGMDEINQTFPGHNGSQLFKEMGPWSYAKLKGGSAKLGGRGIGMVSKGFPGLHAASCLDFRAAFSNYINKAQAGNDVRTGA